MQRRAAVAVAAYAAVAGVHLVLIAAGHPWARPTKWLLMPVLLGAVLSLAVGAARAERATASRRATASGPASATRAADEPHRGAASRPASATRAADEPHRGAEVDPSGAAERRAGHSPRAAIPLLAAAVTASWAGDVLLGPSFVVGLAAFALAHVAYLTLFLGPVRSRRPSRWVAAAYLAWVAALLPVLWPHLGSLAVVVTVYGVILAATATAATAVNGPTGWGGLLFLASDSLLAFRVFDPGFADVFPDPWQDLTIMALYCAAQGLMAFGVLRWLLTRRDASARPGARGRRARGPVPRPT